MPGHSMISPGADRFQLARSNYVQARQAPNQYLEQFAAWYLRFLVLNLDGPGRIRLVHQQKRGDLKNPTTPLARLLTNDDKRQALRGTIFEALGLYFAIDAQVDDKVSVRFGAIPPPDERSFNDEALEYMRKARGIEQVSDGVKAFTGILLQVSAGDPKIIIVDEPEAFLHPSLASKLGNELAKGAATEKIHIRRDS